LLLTLAVAAAVLLSGCNDYNPYLGVPPSTTSVINSISPAAVTAGHPDFTITVTGANFVSGSTVILHIGNSGTNLPTTFVSDAQVTASVSQSLVTTPGIYSIDVTSPGSTSGINAGNNISNFATFTVCSATTGCPTASVTSGNGRSASGSGNSGQSVSISATGRYVAFVAASPDSSAGSNSSASREIFVRDTCQRAPAGCTPHVILASPGLQGSGPDGPSRSPSISADGRFIAFASDANNLVEGDSNGVTDIFLRDTCNGAVSHCTPSTIRISIGRDGIEANGPSSSPSISPDAHFIEFRSDATNLVSANPFPANSAPDGAFLRDTCIAAESSCTPTTTVVPGSSASQQ